MLLRLETCDSAKGWYQKRNRKVRRKVRGENNAVDFRYVELEKLVGYPDWDEQPTIGKYRTKAQREERQRQTSLTFLFRGAN